MNIGNRLKHYRTIRQLDHDALASSTGLTPSELVEIEAGQRPLSHQEVETLAKALNVSIDDLFDQGSVGASIPEESSALIPAAKLAALLDEMNKSGGGG